MKKYIIFLLAAAMAIVFQTPVATAAEPSYIVVVPLIYNKITEINDNLFISGSDSLVNLYNFSGELIIGNKKDIEFAKEWIKVKTDDGWGVYSRDGKEIVPCRYTVVSISDKGTCMAMVGDKFVRPGEWYGERCLYDLSNGKIVGELGYGSEFIFGELSLNNTNSYNYANGVYTAAEGGTFGIYAPDRTLISDKYKSVAAVSGDIVYVTNSEGKVGGIDWWGNVVVPFLYNWTALQSRDDYPLMILAQNFNGTDTISSSTFYDAYNRYGELLVGRRGYLEYHCGGRIIIGFDGSDGQNFAYSERGRLIVSMYNAGFSGLYDGDYICAFSDKPYIINSDGEIVIKPGVFNSYDFNYTGSGTSKRVSNNGAYIIVSKDGKYGVITLPNFVPQTSSWAGKETGKALKKKLVPDDIQKYWRDNCTREEFCHMLALSLENMTGKSISALIADKESVTFSDCDDADVLAVAALGIVKGVGNNRFAPGFFITRQEAAVMLTRAADLLGIKATGGSIVFIDADTFADWAAKEIAVVSTIVCGENDERLMQGVNAGRFDPQGSFTVEQSAVTLLRLTESDIRRFPADTFLSS